MLFFDRSIRNLHVLKVSMFTIVLAFFAVSCGSKKPVEEKPTVEKKKEVPPVCISGCMPNEDGVCGLEALVSEGVGVEKEFVECDARCCEEGVIKNQVSVDSDGDGIYDSADQCPNEAEDYDDYHDKDGCPEVDNDEDGIIDDDDLCPLDPEDMDGIEDHDGCPE